MRTRLSFAAAVAERPSRAPRGLMLALAATLVSLTTGCASLFPAEPPAPSPRALRIEPVAEVRNSPSPQPVDPQRERARQATQLGAQLAAAGSIDAALRQLRLAATLQPDWALARNNLGYAYLTVGRTVQACGELAEALKLEPANATVRRNLVDALKALRPSLDAQAATRAPAETLGAACPPFLPGGDPPVAGAPAPAKPAAATARTTRSNWLPRPAATLIELAPNVYRLSTTVDTESAAARPGPATTARDASAARDTSPVPRATSTPERNAAPAQESAPRAPAPPRTAPTATRVARAG